MKVYVYQADLWCEDCGRAIRRRIRAAGQAPADSSDETSYDSDEYPKGPYSDGGGEADSPQHCGAHGECLNAFIQAGENNIGVGQFLENALTTEGINYVRESIREHEQTGRGDPRVISLWKEHYADVL